MKVTAAAGFTAISTRFVAVAKAIAMLAAYSWSGVTKKLIVAAVEAEVTDVVSMLNVSLDFQTEYPPCTTILCPGPGQPTLHSFHRFYYPNLCFLLASTTRLQDWVCSCFLLLLFTNQKWQLWVQSTLLLKQPLQRHAVLHYS